jgi:hypothetical protein
VALIIVVKEKLSCGTASMYRTIIAVVVLPTVKQEEALWDMSKRADVFISQHIERQIFTSNNSQEENPISSL